MGKFSFYRWAMYSFIYFHVCIKEKTRNGQKCKYNLPRAGVKEQFKSLFKVIPPRVFMPFKSLFHFGSQFH